MLNCLDMLFPRYCYGCWKSWAYLCFECKKQLVPHPEICPVCHRSSSWFSICSQCRSEWPHFLEWILIGFAYKTLLKKIILKLKFYHKKDIASFLAERAALLLQLHPLLSSALRKQQIVFSFVPSHWYRKYFQKGYNQSELLAYSLGKQLEIPVIPCFKKIRSTTSQVKLSRTERFKNLTSAFVCQHLEKIPYMTTLIIIDDVTTSWATLFELAKTIKHHRPDLQIWWLVLARNIW